MNTLECINILKKIRQRAIGSTVTQLIDYIDGQIDALQTLDNTSLNAVPGLSNTLPLDYVECGETAAKVSPSALPRFRGADMA